MTARVLLLNFAEEAQAEHFITVLDQIQHEELSDSQDLKELAFILKDHSTMEAMVARPSLYCRCPVYTAGQLRRGKGKGKFAGYTVEWIKTQRFGWYVHKRCKRPHSWVVKKFIWWMVDPVGRDILPEILLPLKEGRTSEE